MINQTLKFRKANENDLEFLINLREKTMKEHIENAGLTYDYEEILNRVKCNYNCAKIVMLDNMDIGLLKVDKEEDPWHLIQIQLLPEFQRKGIGERLIRMVLIEAGLIGIDVTLSVLKGNEAKNLYKRLGFCVIDESKNAFKMQFYSQ